jgi:hypothetical protein
VNDKKATSIKIKQEPINWNKKTEIGSCANLKRRLPNGWKANTREQIPVKQLHFLQGLKRRTGVL